MRRPFILLASFAIVVTSIGCGNTNPAPARTFPETDDGPQVTIGDEETPGTILTKAGQALGGTAKLKRWQVGKIKYRVEPLKLHAPYVDQINEDTFQLPGKFKSVLSLKTKEGKEIRSITVGIDGWAWQRDFVGDTSEEEDKNSKLDLHYFANLFFSDIFLVNGRKLNPAPDVKLMVLPGTDSIGGRAVVVLMVKKTDKGKDYWYFDKSTALLLRHMKIVPNPATGAEVTSETTLSEYKFIQGGRVPMRARIEREGKQYDMVILDLQFFDKLDDGEFAKP
jgi:hypothetical protein